MGQDKASLLVDGLPLAERTARLLSSCCAKVTVLGRDPIEGFGFQADSQTFGGPRRALDAFQPTLPLVFVVSCDMPRFSPAIVSALHASIGEKDAAAPILDGYPQPLCALYRASILCQPAEGEDSMMALLRRIDYVALTPEQLKPFGVEPDHLKSCNTKQELDALLLTPYDLQQ